MEDTVLANVVPLVGESSHTIKGGGFDSSQGSCPGCKFNHWSRCIQGSNQSVFLSLSVSLSPINKNILRIEYTNIET